MRHAGLITCGHGPVTPDVMEAYKAQSLATLEEARGYARRHAIDGTDDAYFESRRAEILGLRTAFWLDGWRVLPAIAEDAQGGPTLALAA